MSCMMSRARPKSQIFTILPWESRTFLAAKSRWTHCGETGKKKKHEPRSEAWLRLSVSIPELYPLHLSIPSSTNSVYFCTSNFQRAVLYLPNKMRLLCKLARFVKCGCDHWIFRDNDYEAARTDPGCSLAAGPASLILGPSFCYCCAIFSFCSVFLSRLTVTLSRRCRFLTFSRSLHPPHCTLQLATNAPSQLCEYKGKNTPQLTFLDDRNSIPLATW